MLKSLTFISATGAEMPLLQSDYFNIVDVDGFTRIQSDISSVIIPYVDGDKITKIQAQPRPVTLYLRLKQSAGIEKAKRYIFQFVKPKVQGIIRAEQDGRTLELIGTVEEIDLPRFERGCIMAISLHCSTPYWQDVKQVISGLSQIINLHYFPLDQGGLAFPVEGVPFGAYDDDLSQEIVNLGDASTGLVIKIVAKGEVVNPKIYNTFTGEYVGINDTLQTNDEVTISTVKGEKYILKNGVNIIDKIMSGATFLQLATSVNEFTISADSGIEAVYFTMMYRQLYV